MQQVEGNSYGLVGTERVISKEWTILTVEGKAGEEGSLKRVERLLPFFRSRGIIDAGY